MNGDWFWWSYAVYSLIGRRIAAHQSFQGTSGFEHLVAGTYVIKNKNLIVKLPICVYPE